MSKPSPARHRTANWPSYRALRKRGSLLIWLDRDTTWLAPHDGSPVVFSDAAIQFCLIMKVLFKLPSRQTTGMEASLLKIASGSPVLPDLLDQIPDGEEIGAVTRDGAYDTRRRHTAIIARRATPIIPIGKNGRLWKEDCPAAMARNETLRATRHYGRTFWKSWTGYHAQCRIEAMKQCLKAFGERTAARDPDRQTAEIQIRVALINHFNALCTAEIPRAL
ncbi:MAG: transposase [Cypionkella sp.]